MKARAALLVVSLVLASCASGLPGLRPLTYREPAETRVFISENNCPSLQGQQLAPILATIALGAASKLLEGFGTALTRASEGGALPSSVATANFEVARGRTPKCLIIIRGAFDETEPEQRPITLPAIAFVTQTPGENQALVDTPVRLPPVYELHHYVEIQILTSRDGTALSFAPVYAQFARSMDGGTGGQREISIAVKFDRPGRAQTGSVVLIGPRELGLVHRFSPQDETGRYSYEAAWFSPFHAAATPTEAAPAPNVQVPVTVTTTVIETRPTREFLAFVASVFNASRPSIEGALKSEIDPATRDTELRSGYTARGTFARDLATGQNAVEAYCDLGSSSSASDRRTKSAAALSAQLTANSSAILADTDEPFSPDDLITVSGADVATANGSRCG